MKKFPQYLYFLEKIRYQNGEHVISRSDDGTLYAGFHHRTKLFESDLPEWYIKGQYYRREGYLSTKGITDIAYRPNMTFNHMLRDDILYVAYDGKITVDTDPELPPYDRYSNYAVRVYGPSMIEVLKGAREYSGYDITGIIEQIKQKKEWLRRTHPDSYEGEAAGFDVDAVFAKPLRNGHPQQLYKITLDDYSIPSFASVTKAYYGTLADITDFIGSLEPDKHKTTIDAFQDYIRGNQEATHVVAYNVTKLMEPVQFIRSRTIIESDVSWDFKNTWGFIYHMHAKYFFGTACVLRDGAEYVCCIKPIMDDLQYRPEDDRVSWEPVSYFWGHPGVLMIENDTRDELEIKSQLYFKGNVYPDVKQAIFALESKAYPFAAACPDIFGDG